MHSTSMNTVKELDQTFIQSVWDSNHISKRVLPWRDLSSDYRQRMYQVVVSELMLQQTQVTRVVNKYEEWMNMLPDMSDAANTNLKTVLTLWSGLGYNRRARFLHTTLQILSSRSDTDLSSNLDKLPGIGMNTAGAITAYVDNRPSVYVETNIRTAILHHYFSDSTEKVTDSQILEIVSRTVDTSSPREWYWALMDYGTALKKTVKNISQSAHYKKQSAFEGSERQLRGKVLKILLDGHRSIDQLHELLHDERLIFVLQGMQKDKLISRSGKTYMVYRDGRIE